MKKFFAVLLSILIVFAEGTVAFAVEVIDGGIYKDSTAPLLTDGITNIKTYDGTVGTPMFFRLIPSGTDFFTIETTGTVDTEGELYDGSGNSLEVQDDVVGTNFKIYRQLTAGETYYLRVTNYSGISGDETTLRVAGDSVGGLSAPPIATVQAITGTLQVGATLTGHYTYSDVNGDIEGTSTFKWYRADNASGLNKTEIAGATSVTYMLQAADTGKYISFEVTPVAATGLAQGTAVFSAWAGTIVPAEAAPTATVQAITGTMQVGETLTGHYTYSDVNGDLEGISTYKWYRSDDSSGLNKTAIAGATSATYVLQAADTGKYISFEVTPVASTGVAQGTAVESEKFGAIAGDTTAPVGYSVSIDQGSINNANKTAMSFTFAGAEVGAAYSYTVSSSGGAGSVTGNGAIAGATQQITGIDTTSLPDGTLTLNVTLTDAAANTGIAATDTISKDATAPVGYSVSIDQGSINNANKTAMSFTFAGAEVGAAYNYTISSSGGAGSVTGNGAIAGATQQITGIDTTSLPDGTLTLSVTLTDAAANTGIAATDTISKDATAPVGYSVNIDQGSINNANKTAMSFTFAGAEVGAAYNYTISSSGGAGSVTGNGAIAGATQQITGIDTTSLPDGTLTLSVILTDGAGNTGTVATDTVSKDATAPTGYSVVIDQGSINNANQTAMSFTLSGAEVGAAYHYTVSSSGGGTVTGNGTVSVANQQISGINITSLLDGTLTLSVTLTDTVGNIGTVVTDTVIKDTAAPTISSGALAMSNGYIDIVYSEGVYGASDGVAELIAAKLALTFAQNGGTATNAVISSVKQNDNVVEGAASALVGGETTVRVFLTITGTPNGLETIEVTPADGASVYDKSGNAMLALQTPGAKTLNDQTAPTLVSASRTDNAHIIVTLSKNCVNIVKANDGGFSVTETGTGVNYAVSGITQGMDTSHVVLTVADMGISAQKGVTVKYTAGGNGTVEDTLGNTLETDGVGVAVAAWDTLAPTISSGALATSNGYIDIVYSEGVYGASDGVAALTAAKLALTFAQNGGTATNAVISSVKQNDNVVEGSASALVGGETTVRVFLNITGTPNGLETIEMRPTNGTSIYDRAGNAMQVAQTSGVKTMTDKVEPTPGSTGTITVGSTTATTVNLSWAAGADAGTIAANLQYKLLYSIANNITNKTDAEVNGTVSIDWTPNVISATVSGLTQGTTYYFNVLVKDAAGNIACYTSMSAIPTQQSSSSGGSTNTPNAVVEVNGQKQDAGTANTQTTGGQTVTTIKVDDTKLNKILDSGGDKPTVTLPANKGSDVVIGELNGQTVKNMEKKEAVLEIKTGTVSYTLPASQINIDVVSSQIGSQVELKDIKVSVKIAEPSADTVKVVEDTAKKNSYQIVVKPVEFEITCTSGSKTVEVTKFNGYVERTVAIPDGIDPSKITTGIVLNADGTFRHVPTTIIKVDGKYYAKINSLTNSTYSVIWNPVEFSDVVNYWAKAAINDMGSRMVVSGDGTGKYNPSQAITRAEFAAIVVRAMGLAQGTMESSFHDVALSDWFNGYVDTASAYGLIAGYDAKFYGPNDTITREQAMAIIARAMQVTKLEVIVSESEMKDLLAKYSDGTDVSDYAKKSVAQCLKSGIVNGTSSTTISPKDQVTRAEVAVMVQHLLQKSNLINK